MVRAAKGGRPVQVRLPEEEIEELDAWCEELRVGGAIGTSGVTRSDLIRDIVGKALRERREARKGKAKR